MASKARSTFDKNSRDIKRLLELHLEVGGDARGRRYGLEVINKSAVILTTAFWEAYCEDVAAEGLEHIVKHAKSSDVLPLELKKIIAKKLKNSPNELELWRVADDGWRQFLNDHLSELKEVRDRKLNTPKTKQIDALFQDALGIVKISSSWRWARKMSIKRASEKLDKYVSLRGAIAHRGQHDTSVTKSNVTDYFEFVNSLVGKTGGAVNSHVKKVTGKPLWK